VNGAYSLLKTLTANGVTTCFANPGTSEMHFVAGLDEVTEMRGILCLFEGVATGAADGYARATSRPAATLLHLGPGLANGWANLHNARRARVPLINIVGDHATYHAKFDAPLQSDIAPVASALRGWLRAPGSADGLADDAADAVAAAYGPPGRVATLVLAADVSWGEVTRVRDQWPLAARSAPVAPDELLLAEATRMLRTKRSALFVGGTAVARDQLALAQRVAQASGSRVIVETFPAIMDRGAGIAGPERMNYISEFAQAQLEGLEALILIGATEPVGFFAYPNVKSELVPPGCHVLDLAPPGSDTLATLDALVLGLDAAPLEIENGERPLAPHGELTTRALADAVAATIPEGLIIADESATGGAHLYPATRFSPPHRFMAVTGGAIGYGLPAALGAAVGSGQRVLALEADGSMMYTPQALWTMAREGLDVTVVALSNRSYAILTFERQRVGAVMDGQASQRMLELDDPALDLCSLAKSMGVPSTRATSADELVTALQRSYATPGPMFIEAMLPKGLS
jgi:acetolactate synthase-1/2/3 large subunit